MTNSLNSDLTKIITKSGIISNRESGKIYTATFGNNKGRYVTAYIVDRTDEKEDIKILASPKIEVRVTFIFDKSSVLGVEISRFKNVKGLYQKDGALSLSRASLSDILGILELFAQLDLKAVSKGSLILDESIVGNVEKLGKHLRTIIADEEGRKVLASIVSSSEQIREEDIHNIANKKSQLKTFDRFLSDQQFFGRVKQTKSVLRDEDLWQRFFENNKWIFGYGLDLVFSNVVGKKLQETTVGRSIVQGGGKRPDALLKTAGMISNLMFGEIKLPTTPLMVKDNNHSEVYYPSSELVNAVAQVQKTIHKTITSTTSLKIEGKDSEGFKDSTKDVYMIEPRGIVVIGSLEQFIQDKNINEEMYVGFQLYRSSIHNPQIITFDELYARTENIIENIEETSNKTVKPKEN